MPALLIELTNESGWPEDLFDEIVSELFDRIVERTPVDTGLCMASWEIQKIGVGRYQIYNPIEYVSYLEDGHSQQAPDGIVEPTLAEVPEIAAEIS